MFRSMISSYLTRQPESSWLISTPQRPHILLPTMASSSASSPALLFDERAESSVTKVIIHPLVMFHVLDHHTRRQEETGRVIGTLLGRRNGKTVEITNCFAVPHAERGDEVAIGKDFNKAMLELHLKSNRKEQFVGWYASAAEGGDAPSLIGDTSSLIHEFYATESEDGDPVHLVIDTRLRQDNISIKAYRSSQVVLGGESMGNLFHEVSVSLKSNEPESICLNQLIAQETQPEGERDESDDLDRLHVSMSKLHELLGNALQYIDSVVEGKVRPDAELGRRMADALATVPRTRPEVFERLFQDSLQDLLMVSYLSNITRTQLTVAEKLNASLGVSTSSS